ncbi:MAG: hypothetical protein M1832_003069 [Thelocarpon impressellum]|nr:MAG: hypothetical protein M1832_003069 [Thelocarpon impressellum]
MHSSGLALALGTLTVVSRCLAAPLPAADPATPHSSDDSFIFPCRDLPPVEGFTWFCAGHGRTSQETMMANGIDPTDSFRPTSSLCGGLLHPRVEGKRREAWVEFCSGSSLKKRQADVYYASQSIGTNNNKGSTSGGSGSVMTCIAWRPNVTESGWIPNCAPGKSGKRGVSNPNFAANAAWLSQTYNPQQNTWGSTLSCSAWNETRSVELSDFISNCKSARRPRSEGRPEKAEQSWFSSPQSSPEQDGVSRQVGSAPGTLDGAVKREAAGGVGSQAIAASLPLVASGEDDRRDGSDDGSERWEWVDNKSTSGSPLIFKREADGPVDLQQPSKRQTLGSFAALTQFSGTREADSPVDSQLPSKRQTLGSFAALTQFSGTREADSPVDSQLPSKRQTLGSFAALTQFSGTREADSPVDSQLPSKRQTLGSFAALTQSSGTDTQKDAPKSKRNTTDPSLEGDDPCSELVRAIKVGLDPKDYDRFNQACLKTLGRPGTREAEAGSVPSVRRRMRPARIAAREERQESAMGTAVEDHAAIRAKRPLLKTTGREVAPRAA